MRENGTAGSGCGGAVIKPEGDFAEAEKGANHLGAATTRDAASIVQEPADTGGRIARVEGHRADDAEACGTDHPAAAITAGEGEGDMVDAVRAAHIGHAFAHPGEHGIGQPVSGGQVPWRGELPGGLADANTFPDEGLDAAMGGLFAEQRHLAVYVGRNRAALGCSWVPVEGQAGPRERPRGTLSACVDNDFTIDLAEIASTVRTHDVIIVRFIAVGERLLLDFRTNEGDGPLMAVVAPVRSVQERYRNLRELRPSFADPEKIVTVFWPRFTRSLEETGVWREVTERIERSGHPGNVRDATRVLGELMNLEMAQQRAAVRGGSQFQTLWSATRMAP